MATDVYCRIRWALANEASRLSAVQAGRIGIMKGLMNGMLKNFWFITLFMLFLFALESGLTVPLRVAFAANALVIILDIVKQVRRDLCAGREKS